LTSDRDRALEEELRSVTRQRIVEGAVRAVAQHGLRAAVDQVAAEAGVSRRTVFRHFRTHDEVIAAAVASLEPRYDAHLSPTEAPVRAELETWLSSTLRAVHRINADVLGKAFWEAHLVAERDYPEEVKASVARVLGRRHRWAQQVTFLAWKAKEAPGSPPDWLVEAMLLMASGFATNGFASSGLTVEEGVKVAVRTMVAALDSAAESHRRR
jgi:AcrR family transcriptional regulator